MLKIASWNVNSLNVRLPHVLAWCDVARPEILALQETKLTDDRFPVDELQDVARISGHPLLERVSVFHALNHKMIARNHARLVGKAYEEMNLIVAHLGGGITVGAHLKGRVVDVNQGLDGDGPFGPERSGTLPVGALAKLCYSGEYTLAEVKKMITGKGGYMAYFGINDAYSIGLMAEQGNEKAIRSTG